MKRTRPKPVITLEIKQLKELRETAGITQEELAAALPGETQKTVEAIENGRKRITEQLQRDWRRAVKRIAWERAVSVGAIPASVAPPDRLESTELEVAKQ